MYTSPVSSIAYDFDARRAWVILVMASSFTVMQSANRFDAAGSQRLPIFCWVLRCCSPCFSGPTATLAAAYRASFADTWNISWAKSWMNKCMTQLMSIPTIIQMVKLLWQVRQEALSQDLDPRGKLAACCQSSSLKAMRACSHTREQMLLACVCIQAGAQQSWGRLPTWTVASLHRAKHRHLWYRLLP